MNILSKVVRWWRRRAFNVNLLLGSLLYIYGGYFGLAVIFWLVMLYVLGGFCWEIYIYCRYNPRFCWGHFLENMIALMGIVLTLGAVGYNWHSSLSPVVGVLLVGIGVNWEYYFITRLRGRLCYKNRLNCRNYYKQG